MKEIFLTKKSIFSLKPNKLKVNKKIIFKNLYKKKEKSDIKI